MSLTRSVRLALVSFMIPAPGSRASIVAAAMWAGRVGIFRAWIFPLIHRTRWLSLEVCVSTPIANCRGRSPSEIPWTQEAYLVVTLLFGVAALVFHQQGLIPARSCCWWILLVALPLYWVFELLAFVLRWLFSDRGPVISFQRSLAGVLLNVVGVVVFFAAALIGFGCVIGAGAWTALRSSFRIFASLGGAADSSVSESCWQCASLVIAEGAMGYLLTVVIIGAVAALVAAKRRP